MAGGKMKWRFLLDAPRNAATNMAVDEALFLSTRSGSSPPTVRLYQWSRPSLTIGYRQIFNQVCDVEACESLGIDVVRRISGGRAVLHDQELTYCVCAPLDGKLRGLSIRQSYSWVTGALRAAFRSLGIQVDPPAKRSAASRDGSPELPCLAVPTGHEITHGGRKLVGSAQKWSRRCFLQHGSILLDLNTPLWLRATGLPPDTDLGAVGLSDIAGRPLDLEALCEALERAFQDLLGEAPSGDGLSAEEATVAELLGREKYGSRSWNVHRVHEREGRPHALNCGLFGLFC